MQKVQRVRKWKEFNWVSNQVTNIYTKNCHFQQWCNSCLSCRIYSSKSYSLHLYLAIVSHTENNSVFGLPTINEELLRKHKFQFRHEGSFCAKCFVGRCAMRICFFHSVAISRYEIRKQGFVFINGSFVNVRIKIINSAANCKIDM